MPHAIPPDWNDVVRRVTDWLDGATGRLDDHESDIALRFPLSPASPPTESASLAPRLAGLQRSLDGVDAAAKAADAAAEQVETSLRDLTRQSEAVRLKLSEKLGRSIG